EVKQDILYKAPNGVHRVGELTLVSLKNQIYKLLIKSFLRDTLLLLLLVSAIIASAVGANRMIMDIPLNRFLRAIRRADEKNVRDPVDWSVQDELGVVTEARALNSELYGEDRLIALLREPAASAGALMERVLTDLDHHTAGADRWDDTTLLAVRRSE
ncbi:MAG: SpoIIE family protein phosphatase, partial [Candidatus Adiutricales bacterium]